VTAPLVRGRFATRNAGGLSRAIPSFDDMQFACLGRLLRSCII
jgi:hypothetical protein